jgi:lactate racemase
MAQTVCLPQQAWYSTGPLEIAFPDSWEIELCHMAGYAKPALSPGEIAAAIRRPVGADPIRVGARGKEQVCIIFDDMSRATRTAEMVPAVLEELRAAGIRDEQIRFVCALGCHGALSRGDFVRKLGEEVVRRFPVFNHNVVGNCTYVGTTSFGTALHINAEVAACDYKIGLGSIVPHGLLGFGGGAKLILPGVASFETVSAMHRMKVAGPDGTVDLGGMGCVEDNLLRQNVEEAAEIAGLDFKIDALLNGWGETAALYAGAPRAAFEAALPEAKSHYLTPRASGCDIVVTNTFAKVNEGEGGAGIGFSSLKTSGGDLVLIANAPGGHVSHYLFGTWGSVANNDFRLVIQLPPQVERLIIFNEYPDLTALGYFSPADKVVALDSWDEVLRTLQERRGSAARVAVYSSAEIQYCH